MSIYNNDDYGNNNIGIFINNTLSELKYNINLNNFNKLKYNFDKIIVFDNESIFSMKLKNNIIEDDLIYKYILDDININNTEDYDIEKIIIVLKEIEPEYFNYITIINDNYIYCDNLIDYFYYINEHDLDFYSYTDSTENNYHHQLYLFSFKSYKLYDFLNKLIDNIKIFDIIDKLFETKMSYLKVAYIESNYKQNIYFNDTLIEYFMKNDLLPIINLYKLNNIINNLKHEIFIKIPDNFDIDIYRLHEDLMDKSNEFLIEHFLGHGQFEGRCYSENISILPIYIRNYLKICDNLLYNYDVPDNFNTFKYKKNNPDLENMNSIELLLHWVNFGNKENRKYL